MTGAVCTGLAVLIGWAFGRSVKFDVLVGVPDGVEEFRKLLLCDDYRGSVVVGVKREGGPLPEPGIEEEVDVVRRVVDQPEG